MSEQDGGPAFPRTGSEYSATLGSEYSATLDGMSLRDYFAGQALVGVLAADAHPNSSGAIPVDEDAARFVAEHVWRYADAMVQTRGRT